MNAPGKSISLAERMGEIIWAIALICLPVTSFPLFSSLTGAIVAPLSILPIVILLVIWGLPFLLHKGDLPKESLALAVFTLVVILSCATAFFIYIPSFKGKSIPGQEFRALFTLAIGLTFYLVTTTWVKSVEKLKRSWKYITFGGILSLAWAGTQAIFILRSSNQYPAWLEQLQSWFAVISPSFSPVYGRVNGFTYEASWFAHQMVMVYLPLWIAATYQKTSAFKFRILRLSIENILLILGLGAFFLSSPRIGLISLFLIIVYIFLRVNLAVHRRIVASISKRKFFSQIRSPIINMTSLRVLTSILIFSGYFLILAAAFFFISQRDWRLSILVSDPPTMKEIMGVLTLNQSAILELSHRFIFLERAVYWMNGWNVFNQYPWLGVGLGNAGFFFPQMAPSIGWATFEIRNVLYSLAQLPNVKSFWFRLLAETGLIGFSLFLTWFYLLFRSSGFSQKHKNTTIRTFALAGQLALLAFIGEGFSIDSFAMPYFWVMAGMIAATAMLCRRDLRLGRDKTVPAEAQVSFDI